MQKNIITNKITPCCGLPFSVIYWWVSNLTLNSESDRQFILSKISQNGILSIDGWKVLVNSGTLETDTSLTKAEFLAWFNCEKQPSCEQLKLIIEGYKLGVWVGDLNEIRFENVLGVLEISDPAPTTQGLYILSDIGTYTNLGGLVAEAGKVNYAYFDGSVWSLVAISVNDLEPIKLNLFNLKNKLDKFNLIYKNEANAYINNAWVDSAPIGANFNDVINYNNTFGIICEPIMAMKGETFYTYNQSGTPFNSQNEVNSKILFLDKDKKVISIHPYNSLSASGNNFIVPNNSAIAYLSFMTNKAWGKVVLSRSSTANMRDKIEYKGKELAPLYNVNPWEGKKIVLYGDSITQFGFWENALKNYFQFSSTVNYGLSGSKLSSVDNNGYNGGWWVNSATGFVYGSVHDNPTVNPLWENAVHVYSNFSHQSRINCIPNDTDIIIFIGGTNDAGVGVPIGDTNFPFNEGTIKGAVCETIRKMQIRCPNAIIVSATPLSGLGSYSDGVNYNQATKINEVSQAIKEASFYMSIPCIDIFGTCGINITNSANFLRNDKVHPTYQSEGIQTGKGSGMILRALISGLKNIEPFDVSEYSFFE